MFRRLFATLVLVLMGAHAAYAGSASTFVSSMADRAIGVMGNAGTSPAAKKSSLRGILLGSFDLNAVSKFALGTTWRSLDAGQKAEYQRLYQDMVVEVYSRRFNDYSGQTFTVTGEEEQDNGDVLVHSVVKSKSSADVKVDWRVRTKAGAPKVVDVLVEGVSMAVTQRSDFASVMQQGGGSIEPLLRYLKDQARAKVAVDAKK